MNGGAIALGHPLDKSFLNFLLLQGGIDMWTPIRCTGTRQIVTGLSELGRRQGKVECNCSEVSFLTNIYFVGSPYINVYWHRNGGSSYFSAGVILAWFKFCPYKAFSIFARYKVRG